MVQVGFYGATRYGWHMGTHATAFAIAICAYTYARKHGQSSDFSFGTGKVNYLAGFASAVILGIVALLMIVESLQRLVHPELTLYSHAIAVACIGLVVNLISVSILHEHQEHHHDHNIKAAYLHVLADALTSMLAIFALLAGLYFGWQWIDALMGIVGAIIISRWAYQLIKQTSAVLLDKTVASDAVARVKKIIESDDTVIVHDIHVWAVAEHHNAAILSIAATGNGEIAPYKKILQQEVPSLSNITIELR
ncbi:MAG: cation diffusion facilitator family transporter [Lentisphaeria bacterium]